ncbi:MAG: carbon-nitrogen hydrolase family protein [Thermoprotei archaeon]
MQLFKHRLADGLPLVEEALKGGSKMVLLPEKWATESQENTVTRESHPFIRALCELSSSYDSLIVSGALYEKVEEDRYITAYVCARGDVRAKARKMHLFQSEKKVFQRGENPVTVDFDGLRLGVAVCYDIDFPETVRLFALQGCDLLLVPSKIIHQAAQAWMIYVEARALENRLPVAFANVVQQPHFKGGSALVDLDVAGLESSPLVFPRVRGMGEVEGVGVFELEPADYREIRGKRLSDRNPKVDALMFEV